MATVNDLIFDCLQLGLEGEKFDFELKRDSENAVMLSFEGGRRVRVTLESTADGA
jgi:hypothetical protein